MRFLIFSVLTGLIFFNVASASECPHEALTHQIHSSDNIELRVESKHSSNVVFQSVSILEIENTYYTIRNLFGFNEGPRISIVFIHPKTFFSIYNIRLFRGGYYDYMVNAKCGGQEIIFIRLPIMLDRVFLYTLAHEFFHSFHFQICGNSCNENLWIEEGLAEVSAHKASGLPPLRLISSFLNSRKPISLKKFDPQNYLHINSQYGQGFLFFDFFLKRLKFGIKTRDILLFSPPSLSSFSDFFDLNPDNPQFVNFEKEFPRLKKEESIFLEFVLKLHVSEFKAFYDESILRKVDHNRSGVLPAGHSFATLSVYNYDKESFNPILYTSLNALSLVIINSKYFHNGKVEYRKIKTTFEKFRNLPIEIRKDFESVKLILVNFSDTEDVSYSFEE